MSLKQNDVFTITQNLFGNIFAETSSILFLQINKKYHFLKTFALYGHFNS